MRVALITGVSGQDGWHLARLLPAEGTTVWGATRDGRAPADLPGIRPVAIPDIRFGAVERSPQDDSTPFRPDTPYGRSKAYASEIARTYRRAHGLFVAVGIRSNHESPRRPPSFLSRQIARGAVAIARGETTESRLGWEPSLGFEALVDLMGDAEFAVDAAEAAR